MSYIIPFVLLATATGTSVPLPLTALMSDAGAGHPLYTSSAYIIFKL